MIELMPFQNLGEEDLQIKRSVGQNVKIIIFLIFPGTM